MTTPGVQRFEFAYEGGVGRIARVLRLDERRAFVELSATELVARLGPWRVSTPLSNITALSITGPYASWKVVAVPHLSFADRGLTFGTNARRGVCIGFRDPVPGMEPTARLRHPGLTVTLSDPERFIADVEARR